MATMTRMLQRGIVIFAALALLAAACDELFGDAIASGDARAVPTILLRPASSVGMTQRHYDQIRPFGERLPDRRGRVESAA